MAIWSLSRVAKWLVTCTRKSKVPSSSATASYVQRWAHGCTSWYPLLSKVLKTKFQNAENKCIRFCLELPPRGDIKPSHFWKKTGFYVDLCTSTTIFKYWKWIAPSYLNEIFMPSLNNYNTRSQMALHIPLRRTIKRQKIISFFGPKIWSQVNSNIKTAATTSSFTHRLKKRNS